jgi:hypothetical protein
LVAVLLLLASGSIATISGEPLAILAQAPARWRLDCHCVLAVCDPDWPLELRSTLRQLLRRSLHWPGI